MTESKRKPAAVPEPAPADAGLEVKPVKDLEPDETQSENVRGGFAGGLGGLKGRFSDAALKEHVSPLAGSLAKLREFRF